MNGALRDCMRRKKTGVQKARERYYQGTGLGKETEQVTLRNRLLGVDK